MIVIHVVLRQIILMCEKFVGCHNKYYNSHHYVSILIIALYILLNCQNCEAVCSTSFLMMGDVIHFHT